jgi:hypothetical protein
MISDHLVPAVAFSEPLLQYLSDLFMPAVAHYRHWVHRLRKTMLVLHMNAIQQATNTLKMPHFGQNKYK